jgi:D-amino peptidase
MLSFHIVNLFITSLFLTQDALMKVFISADIEGVAGITHWDEAAKTHPDYQQFRQRMTTEVLAACEGAIRSGASEIYIKDAHGSARNIIDDDLPDCVKLIRGWSGHPFSMVQGLDERFDALLMIGYHSRAGSDTNPLAHTLSKGVEYIKINDRKASEFFIHQQAAALENVPTIFVSGDKGICQEIESYNEAIKTVSVLEGVGSSTISISPNLAAQRIQTGVEQALSSNFRQCLIELPEYFEVEIKYVGPVLAYKASFYPGATMSKPQTIKYETDDYFEVLRLLNFVV